MPENVLARFTRYPGGARRRAGRTARARRLGIVLSAVLSATLLPAEAWAIAPPAPRTGPTLDALQQEEEVDPDPAAMEELDDWDGGPVEPPADYTPTEVTPPTGGTAPVPLDSAGEELVPAGTLPVRIGQASPTEEDPAPPAPSGTWDVTVEPRATTEAAAVDGAIIKLTPPASGSTPVDVELDYGRFEDLFGTEWSSRLKLTQLPECFLTTPELEECGTPITIPTSNDPATGTVRATVDPADGQPQGLAAQSGGGPAVLAATDSASGAGGTYKATSLSATGSWTAGGSGGGFSWSYPLTIPDTPAGPAPKISLSYSSQSVDGRTSVANGQASWIGDGWDYHPGFVERRYRSCNDDRSGTPNNDNGADKEKSDLCWASDNVVMSLGGSTTELVRDDTTGRWVAQNDTGARIEYKDKDGGALAAQTAGYDGEHWVVTTRDGTRYWFGRNTLPGRGAPTNSALTVPVFGNHTGEPCHAATYAASSCTQAWRWNLDYVEDVHGNAMVVDWKKEQNRYAKNEKFKAAVSYDRDAYPTQILYGLRADDLAGPPAGKVVFHAAPRCLESAATCSEAKFESKNYADKQPWWDTPATLHCKAGDENCYVTSPTFWSRVRLSAIETQGQRTPGSTALSTVDRWTLHQSFPKQRTDTHPPLWLESITRVGFGRPDASGNQSSKALPAVTFLPNKVDMPNRVLKSTTDQTPDFDRLRVEVIRTETGGETHVTYSAPCPVGGTRPTPASNGTRCFPVHWSPDPAAFSDENLDKSGYEPPLEWFNKYVVTKVTEMDLVAEQPSVETVYTYEGDAAWAKNTDEYGKPALRTYDQWRGYASVVTRTGTTANTGAADATEQSQTRTRYFRGMSGDAGRAKVHVTLTDVTGTATTVEDLLPYQGMAAETLTYTKAGGDVAARELAFPYSRKTASRARPGLPALEAYRTGTTRTDSIQHISGDRTRAAQNHTTYDDAYGLPTQTYSLTLSPNDSGTLVAGDERCTVTTYVHNTAAHIIGLPDRVRATTGDCAAAPNATTGQIVSDSRTAYDALGAFGTAPVKGLPVQVDTISGGGTSWITSGRTEYDALGRATKVTDAAGNSTTTTYSPATGPAFEVTVTNAAGHATTTSSDPGRGSALVVTDVNGRKTTNTYDELGRITGVWSPSRPVNQDASARFSYQIEDNKPPAVHTRVLRDAGTYEDSITLYDGFLRPRQTQREALGGGRIVTETLYNANGTAKEVRGGYLAEGEPRSELFIPLSLTQVPSSTKTAYDGLGRPVRTTTLHEGIPQHAATAAYGGDWELTRTGMSADGTTQLLGSRATKAETDALGRPSRIRHFTTQNVSAESIDTAYAYDARGHLAEVKDAKQNAWTYTYDARGRMTSSTDPDTGVAYFGYNALDQQVWSKDNQGRLQYTTYDVLGRQTELREDSATGPLVAKWTFDTLPGAKGQPVAATRYNDGAAFTSEVTGYDTGYRPTGSRITIPSTPMTTGLAGTYTYASTYTRSGKVQSVDLPATPGGLAAEKVITRYDGEDSPTTVSGLAWYTADTFLGVYGEVLRTASGEAPRRVWTTNVYDEHTGRLVKTTADRETAPHPVSATTYRYDTVGNITSINEQRPTGTEEQCFSYDPMGRLVHAWTDDNSAVCPRTSTAPGAGPARADVSAGVDGGGYWHSYAFDEIGNRTSMTVHDRTNAALDDTYTYTTGKALGDGTQRVQPHTLTQVDAVVNEPGSTVRSQSTYAYDASGNTTQRVIGGDTQTLTWDRRNKLTSVDTNNDGTPDVKYLYDASGNRLVEDDGTTRTLFLGEAEIVVDTAGQALDARRYYSSPGAPTTVRTTGGKTTGHKLTVMLSDHHSTATTSVELTDTQPVTRRRFDPYGNPRGTEPTTWPDRRTYLGVGIDDPATGLTHIGAREYDASTGRFISADPIIDFSDPLQMNGYTYANGNPITYADPTGLKVAECGMGELSCRDNGTRVVGTGPKDPGPATPTFELPSGRTVEVAPNGDSVAVDGVYVPTHQQLIDEFSWASSEHTYGYDLKLWTRSQCTVGAGEHNMSFCHTAAQMGWMGETRVEVDLLDVIGARDVIDCAGGSGEACKRATADAAVSAATGGTAKLGRMAFKVLKAAFKKGDSVPIACLTNLAKKHSFPAGTQVELADGTEKPIEEVEMGDKVLATDPETGVTTVETVMATIYTSTDKTYVDISVATPDGVEFLTTTDHHPFWSESDRAWVDAGDLTPGTTLRTSHGDQVEIKSVRVYNKEQDTYNLTVADVHTYYVLAGATPVLVHNSNCPTGKLSDRLPQGMSRHFVNAYDDIRAGRGVPQTDPATGAQKVFQGKATHEKRWAGALEYRVPGSKGDSARILAKTLPDGRMVMGWTNDHYKTIKPFSAPHFPDSGW
ncbi:polymorphic toxin-type HINT domain-containing protein [Streptomyces fradiae]|uniref:polymorphic toxin-type HINT domain-containing protein n=1 Tax=Streptomyces fradiae TaxID=1906 RepID=UPI002156654F|nr:polymorphic toxin-type HINT domain-containing protein [Streptomyces fradiae]